MTPEEQAQKQAKRAADDKVLRTKGIVGSKEERAAFRARKEGLQRERALEKMTPEQRKAVQANEVKAKQAQQAKAAQEQRKADDKVLRTKGIVGSKEERAAFRARKDSIKRERALEKMTPEQREKALAREAQNKQRKETEAKREADDKARRTVGVVGGKEGRAAFRAEKERLAREDALAKMTPEEREAALAQEAKQQQQAQDAKLLRTTAIVGTKEEREAFREARAEAQQRASRTEPPASIAPVVVRSSDELDANATSQAWAVANELLALIA